MDLPLRLSNIVWQAKYSEYQQVFERVKFDEENFDRLLHSIHHLSPSIPVCIASSHISAYDFVKTLHSKRPCEKVRLVNVDLHHDLMNSNESIDCGNWIGALLNEDLIRGFRWIAKPLSQRMYGLTDDELKAFHATFDFSTIDNEQFDALFVCKSNPWLLPSFDNRFCDFLAQLKSKFGTNLTCVDVGLTVPRNISGAVRCNSIFSA